MSDRTSGGYGGRGSGPGGRLASGRTSGRTSGATRGRTSGRASGAVSGGPHVIVRVGSERFALPASVVQEAIDAPVVTWVPGASEGVLGQLRYRFRTVTAFDGAWALGVPRGDGPGAALILRDGARRLAIVVDDVDDIVVVEPSLVLPIPGGTDADGMLNGVYIWGNAGELLLGVVRAEPFMAKTTARLNGEHGGTS